MQHDLYFNGVMLLLLQVAILMKLELYLMQLVMVFNLLATVQDLELPNWPKE